MHARLVPSELAFLRFVAGIRALLAALIGAVLLIDPTPRDRLDLLVLLPYMVWAAVLLWRTLGGWPAASAKTWLWLDAAVLLMASQLVAGGLPLLGVSTVLPVVALAVLAGAGPAMALALAVAAAMLLLSGSLRSFGSVPLLPLSVPLIVLALGPAAALLVRPSRELRQRLKLIETLHARTDPRQGLQHHIDILLDQLSAHFTLRGAWISLRGPEPRIFQWRAGAQSAELSRPEAAQWGQRFASLPRHLGSLHGKDSSGEPSFQALNPITGAADGALPESAAHTLERIGAQVLALPLVNYGQPQGTLCLQRDELAFTSSDLRWLNDVMREAMPLLERSDLLEQLQRETAQSERERIGRDLHDSAVQPYLGLKYGLEALLRQAGSDNPLRHNIQQLATIATQELQTLRDVISGLRRGDAATLTEDPPLAALQREAQRFESLYGLKVNIFAPDAPRLRGAAAKGVLHMVNEALTNVRRHTSATAVTILLDVNQADVVLRLRNDHGRDETLPVDFVPLSLSQRAAEFGGRVEVNHQPEFTEVLITLPLLGALG